MVKAPARREVIRHMADRELSERHALRIFGRVPVPIATSLRPTAIPRCESGLWPWRIGIDDTGRA